MHLDRIRLILISRWFASSITSAICLLISLSVDMLSVFTVVLRLAGKLQTFSDPFPTTCGKNIFYSMILCRISNSWSFLTSTQNLLSHAGQFEGFCWVEPLWFSRSMTNTGPPQLGHRIAALFPKGSQRTGNSASSIHLKLVIFDKSYLLLFADRIEPPRRSKAILRSARHELCTPGMGVNLWGWKSPIRERC